MPIRIRLSRSKGWKLPPDAVSVARGPGRRWGNPFVIGEAGPLDRMPVDRLGATHFFACLFNDAELRLAAGYPTVQEIRQALRGRDLACWCPLDQPCHADVLLQIANSEE
jgi:hypothetical protein